MQENIETTNCEIQDMDLKIAPVQTQERIEVLDVIRGFALLGVLIINMAFFSSMMIFSFFRRATSSIAPFPNEKTII